MASQTQESPLAQSGKISHFAFCWPIPSWFISKQAAHMIKEEVYRKAWPLNGSNSTENIEVRGKRTEGDQ